MRLATGMLWSVVLAAGCAGACDTEPVGPIEGSAPAPAVAPSTEGESAGTETEPAGPSIDPAFPAPEHIRMVGASRREALLRLGSWSTGSEYYGIVDLETGCLTETHADELSEGPSVVEIRPGETLEAAVDRTRPAVPAINSTELQERLASFIHLLRRVGARTDRGVAFDDSGRHILFERGDGLLRSSDGGRTFRSVDRRASYGPVVTGDGAWGLYRRNTGGRGYRTALVPMGSSRGPRLVGPAHVNYLYIADDGARVLAVREPRSPGDPYRTESACIDRLEPPLWRPREIGCFPHRGGSEDILSASGDHRWAVIETTDSIIVSGRSPLHLRVVDLTDGTEVITVEGSVVSYFVDDRGIVAWGAGIFPDYRAHVRSTGGSKDLGWGNPLGWIPGGRLLIENTRARAPTPSRSACGLVRVVTVDPAAF